MIPDAVRYQLSTTLFDMPFIAGSIFVDKKVSHLHVSLLYNGCSGKKDVFGIYD